jgi:hypothetical protein
MIGFVWFLAFASIGAGNGMTALLCFMALIFHYLG